MISYKQSLLLSKSGAIAVAGACVLALITGAATLFFFDHFKNEEKDEVQRHLAEVGRVRAQQLSSFLFERRGDARVLAELLKERMPSGWWRDNGGDLPESVRRLLDTSMKSYGYTDALILDAGGNVRYGSGVSKRLTDTGRSMAMQALEKKSPLMDLYFADPALPDVFMLDTFMPFTGSDGKAFGVLILRGNWDALFKLTQPWPEESASAEYLLVRKDGADVVYLNQLRHLKQRSRRLRMPLNDNENSPAWPAISAVQGKYGALDSIDYRGVPVLAYTLAVPDSDWSMVVKVDRDEALQFAYRMERIALIVVAVIIVLAGSLIWGWRRMRERAQREFHNSQQQLAGIVGSAMDPIITVNSQQIVTLFNKAAENTFGYSAAEITGQPLERLIPARFRSGHKQKVEGFGATGVTSRANNQMLQVFGVRANGEEFPIELSISQVEIDGEKRYTAILRDITERDKAETRLRVSEARLNEAQQIAKVGSWELDLVKGTLVWSDEIFRLFEIDKAKFGATYEAFLNAIHPEDRDAVNAAYSGSLQDRKPYEIKHRLLMADGRIKWVHERCESDFDAEGKPLRSVGTVQDITALHDAEERLRVLNTELEVRVQERTAELKRANRDLEESLDDLSRAHKQLVQSEKMAALGGLVAGVAHEINTPVGIGVTAASHLDMKVQELTERYRSGKMSREDMEAFLAIANESSDMVLSNLKRAADLIRSFKQVAVDQSGGRRRHFNLKSYLEEVLTSLGPQLNRTRHEVIIECREDLDLYSHPGSYSQIVTNLVMNSMLHGFEGIQAGHIAIRVIEETEGLLLRYTDDGRGIAPEHLPRIFEPFYTTKRGAGGSGLGLHVIFNLITQGMGGSISCQSEPGKGVAFDIRIPRAALFLDENGMTGADVASVSG